MQILKISLAIIFISYSLFGFAEAPVPQNPIIVSLDIPEDLAPSETAGGIIVADINNDNLMDYLVSVRGHIAAYHNNGTKLWVKQYDLRIGGSSEREGLPGHHAPGLQIAYVDNMPCVLFLNQNSELIILEGKTGNEIYKLHLPVPQGATRWEHLVVANFRGKGDQDLLVQATNAEGYRMGRYLAVYGIPELIQNNIEPLWQRDDFGACAHNGARVADLDGDGKDEILGGTLLNANGETCFTLPLKGHIDAIHAGDVLPEIPGLEVIALEEGGGNRIFCYSTQKLIWETHYQHWEPQNTAIGEFDCTKPGLEIWCRSRFDKHQKPFIFDANGNFLATYEMDKVAPEGWTDSGIEVIHTIHWTGHEKQLAAAKERHKSGKVCIFDPISGEFIKVFDTKADRLYVADVLGDWREELIILNGKQLEIYWNPEPNPRPNEKRLWESPLYRRNKMTYNYYSP